MSAGISQRNAITRLRKIMGESAYIEHSYFSPMRRNQWFTAYRKDNGTPIVRGQGNTLLDAVEEAEKFYGRPTREMSGKGEEQKHGSTRFTGNERNQTG